jgi:hypothetical protein
MASVWTVGGHRRYCPITTVRTFDDLCGASAFGFAQ